MRPLFLFFMVESETSDSDSLLSLGNRRCSLTTEVFAPRDLFFGDSGKGTIVDTLVRKYGAHAVMREGGPQAGHGVVTSDGRYHIFAQIGSATFVPGVTTFLSRDMLVDPWRLMMEVQQLVRLGVTDVYERLAISANAYVISPLHAAANRLRERARGDGRHGSCGLGIGETMSDVNLHPHVVLRVSDLNTVRHLYERLCLIQHFKREQLHAEGVLTACWNQPDAQDDIDLLLETSRLLPYIVALDEFNARVRIVRDSYLGELLEKGSIVAEHSQSVLLDQWRGFDPYTTWRICTTDSLEALLAEQGFTGPVHHIGVVRGYGVRHGPGPFPTEDATLTRLLPDPPSARNEWQGQFRVGHFDAVLVRYAINCCERMDSLVVTCLDRMSVMDDWRVCTHYKEGDSLVRDLPLGPYKDLEYQRVLTKRLFKMQPSLETSTRAMDFKTRVQEHIACIESELNIPVSILSFGPTAEDKRFLS